MESSLLQETLSSTAHPSSRNRILRRVINNGTEWIGVQSALTGESMPATKKPGDEVFSGSTCKQGEIEAIVIATGVHTFFGKAAHLVDSTNNVGHFQKVIHFIP